MDSRSQARVIVPFFVAFLILADPLKLSLAQETVEAIYDRGYQAFENDDYEKAISDSSEVIRLDATHVGARIIEDCVSK